MPYMSNKIEGTLAVCTPDIDGTKPGAPLKVVQGDIVSWNNMSKQGHWPVPDDRKSYGFFSAMPVDPDSSSTAYNVVAPAGTTISYHCYCHPEERGQIVVRKFGQ